MAPHNNHLDTARGTISQRTRESGGSGASSLRGGARREGFRVEGSPDRETSIMADNRGDYLWGSWNRQDTSLPLSKENKDAVKMMRSYFLAFFHSDRAGFESNLWPKKEKRLLSEAMQTAWTEIATGLRALGEPRNCRVTDVPLCHKAQRVYVIETAF